MPANPAPIITDTRPYVEEPLIPEVVATVRAT